MFIQDENELNSTFILKIQIFKKFNFIQQMNLHFCYVPKARNVSKLLQLAEKLNCINYLQFDY